MDLVSVLRQAGFTGDNLRTAYAIAMRESGGRPSAFNGNRGTGDKSYGLFQINMLGNLGPSRLRQFGLSNERQLLDPLANAKAAFQLSKGGKDFGAWGIGPNAYRQGAGWDTIKKYYDQFPGSPLGAAPAQQMPVAPAIANFADAIKAGQWSLDSSLADTIRLSQQFAHVSGKGIPGTNMRYPRVTGHGPASAVPIVQEAYKWLGTPYSWAGGGTNGPSKGVGRGANTVGFDCSGFLQYLWGQKGVQIPRVTYDQWRTGQAVAMQDLQPGDAVFFHMGPRGPEHVGLFVGGGKFIEAPYTGAVIRVSSLRGRKDYMGARRYG